MIAASRIYHVVVGTSWLSIVLSGFLGSVVGVIGALYAASHLFNKQNASEQSKFHLQRNTDIEVARVRREQDLSDAIKRHENDRNLAIENAQREAAIRLFDLLNTTQTSLMVLVADDSGTASNAKIEILRANQEVNSAFALSAMLNEAVLTAAKNLISRPQIARNTDESDEAYRRRLISQASKLAIQIETVTATVPGLPSGVNVSAIIFHRNLHSSFEQCKYFASCPVFSHFSPTSKTAPLPDNW